MADFEIPVEDFKALQALVKAGDLSAAETRLRKLTKVSAKDAKFFVREMADEIGEKELVDKDEDKEPAVADFEIPVEDFAALRAMIDDGNLSAAETRFRKLTKVSAKDAKFFVREMADEIGEKGLVDKDEDKEPAVADFEIPVEDFAALRAMIDDGNLSAAETRFRKLTKVSAKDAKFFVREMADEIGEKESVDKNEDKEPAVADFEIPVEDFAALRALIDDGNLSAAETRFRKLTKVSAKDAKFFVQEMAAAMEEAELVTDEEETKGTKRGASEPEPEPEPVFTSIPLPSNSSPPQATVPPEPKSVPTTPAPVKPPSSDDSVVRKQLEQAAETRKAREKAAADSDGLRWYERVLPFFAAPLLLGGLIGGLFCGLGFFVVWKVLRASGMSRTRRCLNSLVALLVTYAGYAATIFFTTGTLSFFDSKETIARPAPIEPSNTISWNSPAGAIVEGTDAELQTIFDLFYKPLKELPPVSTSVKDSTLTVVSRKVRIDGALSGVPLIEKKPDLVADLGRGNTVTLLSYALRLPSDEPGSPLVYLDPENPAQPAKVSSGKMPVSKHRKRPVLRCVVRMKRVSKDDVTFQLFDARTRRKVASAKPTRAGEVDFQLGIWHRTPLLMVVEAKTWASSATARHSLSLGEDVPLGLGRAQLAYVGRGHLDGVENGATIESGKPYRLVRTGEDDESGMVIVRYSPPYLAESTSLLLTATKDHLASLIPAFADFKLKPVGPEGDQLGFRVFHVPPTIDNQLQGQGLRNSKSPVDVPLIERSVDFSSDLVSVSFESQRGRGLIAMADIPGMQMALEGENLFDLEIPLMVFEEGDPLELLLRFAADAVEFDLEEIDSELKLPNFLESIEYKGLTPRQALLYFEQLSGVRVVVDSAQRRILLQP